MFISRPVFSLKSQVSLQPSSFISVNCKLSEKNNMALPPYLPVEHKVIT